MLGGVAIIAHSAPLESIVFYVALVWLLANFISSRAYTLEYWKKLNRTFPEIWRDAKSGALPRTPALEQVTNFGAVILMIVFMCLELGLNVQP